MEPKDTPSKVEEQGESKTKRMVKKNILEQFYHKNRDFLIYAMFLNLHLKYRHN